MNPIFEKLGFAPADILLPRHIDWEKWGVVACDQFTSEPEYWEAAEQLVGDAPSALRLILPEAHLNEVGVEQRIGRINAAMGDYLDRGLFAKYPDSLFYIERTQSDGLVRRGLIGRLDLESYDFTPGCNALTRASEGTVLSRIPPRVKVREQAPIELPHVMLLFDDPADSLMGPLTAGAGAMELLYDFDLMLGGGHITGRRLTAPQQDLVAEALWQLASPASQQARYGLKDTAPLLFAVGDGNHSLATAKQCYETEKKRTPPKEWPLLLSRYALVELVNLHEEALRFEPIHRVVFDTDPAELLAAFKARYPLAYEGRGEGHVIRYVYAGGEGSLTVPRPQKQLAAGTLQSFLDDFAASHPCRIDYIHGDEAAARLGKEPGSIGLLLPAMGKDQLFKTVMADGVLPRKTFSMGHARDKRYYIETRKIR